MAWNVTLLSGNESPRKNKDEETELHTREENPDNLFEIVPKLLIDRVLAASNSSSVFLVNTSAGTSSGIIGSNELVGLGFDKTFLLLSKDLNAIEKSVEFNATIDFVLWKKSILLIGLSSSEIVLLNSNTLEKTASKKVSGIEIADSNVGKVPSFFADAFIHSTLIPSKISLVAVGVGGDIYSFPNISLAEDCLDYTQDESISICIDIETIKGSMLRSLLRQNSKVVTATSPCLDIMITGEESGTISVFNIADAQRKDNESEANGCFLTPYFRSTNIIEDLQLPNCKINKLAHCEGMIFVLFSNGQLQILVSDILMKVKQLKLPSTDCFIHDFTLVISNSGSIKLWTIYSDKAEHYVAIYPSPSFKVPEFKVVIPTLINDETNTTSLFKFPSQSSLFDEPTSFIEICPQTGSTKFYHMSEFSTDISLQNLLAKGRFEKAELLATKYEKDMDIVWKAKVQAKFNEVLVFYQQKKDNCQKIFNEILKTLQLIRDDDWICGFIIKEKRVPKLEWVKELLSVGLKRVSGCSSSENGQRLLLTRKKLYTFDQVLPNAVIHQWNDFNDEKNTMFGQCLWFLENAEFQKCEIVWLRHSDEFISEIDVQDLAKFFKILFEAQLNSPEAISLFKTILPFAVEKCEEAENGEGDGIASSNKINGVLLLVRSQLRSLEREKNWPAEALVFTNTLLTVFQDEIKSLEAERENGSSEELKVVKKVKVCQVLLSKLLGLLQALTELSLLKANHSIRIPFEKYTTESEVEVVNSMLRVLLSREEVELFINNFLRPFAGRNKLDMDHLFLEHIKHIAEEVPYFVHASGIPFEERVVTLVASVVSVKIKLQCILIMAENWPVPWFQLMDDLVKRAIDMNVGGDSDCLELQNHIKWLRVQVPYRCLQTKYRLIPHKLAKGFGVQMALIRILKWKKANYYEDCLELIKHTGKYDEIGVRTLRFWIDLSESDLPMEEVIPNELTNTDLLNKMLQRIMFEFRMGQNSCYTEDNWKRFAECARLIANRVNDDKALEFLKLRELIPNLWNDDILTSINYPFSALELLLETSNSKTSQQIIRECNRLSVISFTNYKNLLLLAALLVLRNNRDQKIWDIVQYMTETEELFHDVGNEIIPLAGLTIAQDLVLDVPTLSTQQLETLQEFCRLLANSFNDNTTEDLSKLFGILRIFETLREQEIPLEKEFMGIYVDIWIKKFGTHAILNGLQQLGESLLRFGNKELHCQMFNAVKLELESQARNSFGPGKEKLLELIAGVAKLKNELLDRAEKFVEKETNNRVINLVRSLEEAGFPMNSYALRQRNKGKLISKLLEKKLFQLAAQTALVFDHKDPSSWSSILQQYMLIGSITELKTLLEALKKIADLWVLKEFASAWLKVSEAYPTFRHMCPIPLEF